MAVLTEAVFEKDINDILTRGSPSEFFFESILSANPSKDDSPRG
jgi:hypothetical protein